MASSFSVKDLPRCRNWTLDSEPALPSGFPVQIKWLPVPWARHPFFQLVSGFPSHITWPLSLPSLFPTGQRFFPTLSPRSIFLTGQWFSRSNHATSGSHDVIFGHVTSAWAHYPYGQCVTRGNPTTNQNTKSSRPIRSQYFSLCEPDLLLTSSFARATVAFGLFSLPCFLSS